MAVLLHISPPFVTSPYEGSDLSTRGEGEQSPFCPGKEPRYAHA
jgi:hypothetical protein